MRTPAERQQPSAHGANAAQLVRDQHVGGRHDGDARQGPVGRGDTEHEHPHDQKRAANEQEAQARCDSVSVLELQESAGSRSYRTLVL